MPQISIIMGGGPQPLPQFTPKQHQSVFFHLPELETLLQTNPNAAESYWTKWRHGTTVKVLKTPEFMLQHLASATSIGLDVEDDTENQITVLDGKTLTVSKVYKVCFLSPTHPLHIHSDL
jgi:hypothetical protein